MDLIQIQYPQNSTYYLSNSTKSTQLQIDIQEKSTFTIEEQHELTSCRCGFVYFMLGCRDRRRESVGVTVSASTLQFSV